MNPSGLNLPAPAAWNSSAPLHTASANRLTAVQPLWIALCLPDLPLEILPQNRQDHPLAVVDTHKGRSVLYAVSGPSDRTGLHSGMPLGAAHALCSDLRTYPRDPQAEQARLCQLAAWAREFTSMVTLASPRALLLEVRGSLRLFGGLDRLRHALESGLRTRGHRPVSAIAPTPRASLWLAENGRRTTIQSSATLRTTLGELPVTTLPVDARLRRRLAKTGLSSLQDLWRLPRDGLARRFGKDLLRTLDQALGLEPDPRTPWHPPERYFVHRDSDMEITGSGPLLASITPLVQGLCDYLRTTGGGVTRLHVGLYHHTGPITRLTVGTRRSTRDPGHLLGLFRERLYTTRLDAPVTGIDLLAARIHAQTPETRALHLDPSITDTETTSSHWEGALEQLQARLGNQRLSELHPRPDPRPEQAWGTEPSESPERMQPPARRPLWLLPAPSPLKVYRGRPWRTGQLALQGGPERIESGWWEGKDLRRDYYVATDTDGSRLWIFHDLRHVSSWYLHGYFS